MQLNEGWSMEPHSSLREPLLVALVILVLSFTWHVPIKVAITLSKLTGALHSRQAIRIGLLPAPWTPS
jgi:hypothetical protein